jgi:hypothetical protein
VKETMRKVNIEELSIEVKKRKKTDLKKIETIIGKIITKEKKELMNGLRRKSQKEKRNKYHMPMKVDPKNQISERTRIDRFICKYLKIHLTSFINVKIKHYYRTTQSTYQTNSRVK